MGTCNYHHLCAPPSLPLLQAKAHCYNLQICAWAIALLLIFKVTKVQATVTATKKLPIVVVYIGSCL